MLSISLITRAESGLAQIRSEVQIAGSDRSQQLDFLKPEQKILERYNAPQTTVIELIQELNELTQLARKGQLTDAQQKRRQQLMQLRQDLQDQFNTFLRQPQIQESLAQLRRNTSREPIDLTNLQSLQNNLASLNGVLLYPLILDNSKVGGSRAGVVVRDQSSGVTTTGSSPLDHPYYWAPFILIGNGL